MYVLFWGFDRIFFPFFLKRNTFSSNKILQRNPVYNMSNSGVTLLERKMGSWNSSCWSFNTPKYENNVPGPMLFKYCATASLWVKNNFVCVTKWSTGIETKRALSQVFYPYWISVVRDIHCKMGDGDTSLANTE